MAPARRLEVLYGHVRSATPCTGPGLRPGAAASAPALGRALRAAAYDFVVVGAGSAGCAVASRLSEDPSVSVLLIEAGGSNQRFSVRSPFLTCPHVQNTDIDWQYRTTPQANTDGRVSHWPRGKCLGGSSSINYMLYVRGDPRNYDTWAHKHGCTGWSYEEVLPFFQKSENLMGEDRSGVGAHGKGGPLQVTQMRDHAYSSKDVTERWLQACQAAGIPANPDCNGKSQAGASEMQVTTKDGVRCDTASAFLYGTGALERPNLTVLTNAHVTRVLLQGQRAIGVCVERAGSKDPPIILRCSKEVVLCCGAIGTPQLLMLSGIGPAAHLREKGIECVRDLPVGENLQDHLVWTVIYAAKGQCTKFQPATRPLSAVPNLARYFLLGTGDFCFPYVQATAFDHSRVPGRDESEGNDVQIHWLGFVLGGDEKLAENNMGIKKREDRPLTDSRSLPREGVSFLPTLVLPKSTGRLRLASADPHEHPAIDPQYLTHPHDMDSCVAVTDLCRKIAASPPLSEIIGDLVVDSSIPYPPESVEYTREYIRRSALTVYHPAGTAKMGPAGDATAVVDTRLQVHGIKGLRVADASIMPSVVSGNTNAACIMIGERCAAFITEGRGERNP